MKKYQHADAEKEQNKKRYGVWNSMRKEFQFGIDEPTNKKAQQKLFNKIGYDSYKWRFEIKEMKGNK